MRKKWSRLITFFDWLEGKGLVDRNYARGKKPKARALSYEKFTHEDLVRLLESDEYRAGSFREAFQYWLPLLGLHTGARLEELAQLHLADIRQDAETGVWVIEITEEVDEEDGAQDGKKLKNKAFKRTCPLHSGLLEAGLLAYIADLKRRGYDRLFPELSSDGYGKFSPRASEWFTEYRRGKDVGAATERSRKSFHSFRHTMNATPQKAGVTQEVREALCGHASKAINTRVYGGALVVRQLKEAIDMLKYGIAIPGFAGREEHERARKNAEERKT